MPNWLGATKVPRFNPWLNNRGLPLWFHDGRETAAKAPWLTDVACLNLWTAKPLNRHRIWAGCDPFGGRSERLYVDPVMLCLIFDADVDFT